MKFVMVSFVALIFICPLDVYGGCIKGDCVNGQGTMSFVHGGKYTGQFKNGKLHGHGTLVTSEGTKYIGSFKENRFHGQGTVIFPDGRRYEDHFRDGKMSGHGKMTVRGLDADDLLEKNPGGRATTAFQDLAKWQRGMIIHYPAAVTRGDDRAHANETSTNDPDPADYISSKGWYINKERAEPLDWNNEITDNYNLSIEKEIRVGTHTYNMYMEPDYTFEEEDMGSNWGVQFGIRFPFPD